MDTKQKNKILAAAEKHRQRGAYEKAIRELNKIVQDDPRDVRTLLKIGDIQAKMGDREAATSMYRRVAEFHSEQGFFLKAVAVYKQILKTDPEQIEVVMKLAELYEHLDLSSESMQQYQNLATHYEQIGNAKEAMAVLNRVVELDPDNVAIRVRLAEAYSRDNLLAEAVEQFVIAAEMLKEQNRIGDYVKVAERLVYHDPARLDVIKDLAHLYLQNRDSHRALTKLQLAFKSHPRDIETLTMLGRAFHELGQTAKTAYVFKELAKIHEENGDTSTAMQVYRQILEVVPGEPEATAALERLSPKPRASQPTTAEYPEPVSDSGSSASGTSSPSRADSLGAPVTPSESPQRAAEKKVSKLLTEIDVYVKYGLRAKAIEHLEKILEIDADCIVAYERLRDLHLKANDFEAAASAVRRLVEIHSSLGNDDEAINATLQFDELNAKKVAEDTEFNLEVDDEAIDDLSDDGFVEVSNFDIPTEAEPPQPEVESEPSELEAEEEEPSEDIVYDPGMVSFDESGAEVPGDPTEHSSTGGYAAVSPDDDDSDASTSGDLDPAIEEELDTAEFFLQQGLRKDAREAVRSVLKRNPSYQRARDLLVSIDLADEPADAGAAEANGAETPLENMLPPGMMEDPQESLKLGREYKEQGKLDEAIELLQLASMSPDHSVEAWSLIGRCLKEQGDTEGAVGHFFMAMEAGAEPPLSTELKYETGAAYDDDGDAAMALYWYGTAFEEDPAFKDVRDRIVALGGDPDAPAS